MGIRVKLINNYMSIALNALSSEAAVLCESLGLNLDVAIKVMSGTAAGKGHFTTTLARQSAERRSFSRLHGGLGIERSAYCS